MKRPPNDKQLTLLTAAQRVDELLDILRRDPFFQHRAYSKVLWAAQDELKRTLREELRQNTNHDRIKE